MVSEELQLWSGRSYRGMLASWPYISNEQISHRSQIGCNVIDTSCTQKRRKHTHTHCYGVFVNHNAGFELNLFMAYIFYFILLVHGSHILSRRLVYNNVCCCPLCCCNVGNFPTAGLIKDYVILRKYYILWKVNPIQAFKMLNLFSIFMNS